MIDITITLRYIENINLNTSRGMPRIPEEEYYNQEKIDQDVVNQIIKEVVKNPNIYFHGIGIKLEMDENDRICKIHYTLPSKDARVFFDSLEEIGVKLGMICRNSWVDSLEAKYERSKMGEYSSIDY